MQHDAQRLALLLRQLGETLVTATYCTEEIRAVADVMQQNTKTPDAIRSVNDASMSGRPLLDESTFSVIWQGRSIRLGQTRSFWLLARLARRPNQYVTHLDLLNDVWDDDGMTTATIRSTICHLRKRLRGCGMPGLANAIQGHNGHYMLCV